MKSFIRPKYKGVLIVFSAFIVFSVVAIIVNQTSISKAIPIVLMFLVLLFLCSRFSWFNIFRYLSMKRFFTPEMEDDFSAAQSFFRDHLRMGQQYIFIKNSGYVLPYKRATKVFVIDANINASHVSYMLGIKNPYTEKTTIIYDGLTDSDSPTITEVNTILEERRRYCYEHRNK